MELNNGQAAERAAALAADELVESIRSLGILQPLIARKIKPAAGGADELELLAGRHRLRASTEVGLDAVPVIVHEQLTDADAAMIMVAENDQRIGLHPLEQAAGIQLLLDSGWTQAQVAEHLGRPLAAIAKRVHLGCLIKKWRAIYLDQEDVRSQLPLTIWERIASLPGATQTELLKVIDRDQRRVGTLRDLDEYLSREYARELRFAPWQPSDATLCPKRGACVTCTKRTGRMPLLWEGLDAGDERFDRIQKHERCLDPKCWADKLAAVLRELLTTLTEKHPDLVLVCGQGETPGQAAVAHKLVGNRKIHDSWEHSAPAKGGRSRPCLVMTGTQTGSLLRRHLYSDSPERGGSTKHQPGTPAPLKDRRAKHTRRRQGRAVQMVLAELEKPCDDNLALTTASEVATLAVVLAFGTPHRNSEISWEPPGGETDPWKLLQKYRKMSAMELRETVARQVLDVAKRRLRFNNLERIDRHAKDAEQLAVLTRVDWQAVSDQATEELPEPRTWAKLEADGTPKQDTLERVSSPKKAVAKRRTKKRGVRKSVKRAKKTAAKKATKKRATKICKAKEK